jgi:hypothetical protein
MKRECLGCRRPTDGSYCDDCRGAYNDPEYLRRRAAAIAAEPWCHSEELIGGPCPYPDCGDPAANPLTADHSIAVARGGADSELLVVCRRLNTSKGARAQPLELAELSSSGRRRRLVRTSQLRAESSDLTRARQRAQVFRP